MTKNITKKCFSFWANCPYIIEISKCETKRDCVYYYDCFRSWREKGGIMATQEDIDSWDL